MIRLSDLSFDLSALHAAYRSGVAPSEIVAEAYRRIAAVGDPGIFIALRPEAEVLAEAEALPPFDPVRMPLWGVPFAIKDNIDLEGMPTTAACPDYAYVAEASAFAVARLREAGAIAVGKTNLDQFATGLVGTRTPYPVPRNVLDPAIVPGGSSSGSAVAVARGLVSFALGTDTAGSGRVPAALNNIVGLKPSLGALSSRGLVPACRTLDTISVFALTVPDAWTAFAAAATFDDGDAYARPLAAGPLAAPPPAQVVGVPDQKSRRFFGDAAQAEAFEAALLRLTEAGARIVEIDFAPFYAVADLLYHGAWVAERMAVVEALMAERPEAILPVTRQVIGAASGQSATDAFRGIYRLAELRRRVAPVLAGIDMLCVPTIPRFVTLAELDRDPITPNSELGTYTNFVNLLDLCGIAVPTGPRRDGRPGGVTLLSRAGRDASVAAMAEVLHRAAAPLLGATGHRLQERVPLRPSAAPGEVELAVVGAHMSGLPLNHELTSRGGRFIEATETAPVYRFYALPGGPPARPGMLRTGEGGGRIALEVWALPEAGFGSFVAGVPAPLSIGTVQLCDGRSVKGFLVEQAATVTAEDITACGGWRAYLGAKAV